MPSVPTAMCDAGVRVRVVLLLTGLAFPRLKRSNKQNSPSVVSARGPGWSRGSWVPRVQLPFVNSALLPPCVIAVSANHAAYLSVSAQRRETLVEIKEGSS